ncbi:MAG: class I SAM-dependent methyltransferase [Candidatus Nitrosocosmicus sp.]
MNEHSSNTTATRTTNSSNTVWSLGSYNEFAIFILPVSAHLVKLCNISSGDCVLDVACGTGNTAITAKKMIPGIKVTGIDFTPELLTQAKEQASIADVGDIEWREANVENLPFEDEIFDDVLSSFGHMFAPNPKIAIKEMTRVTKPGGSIAFSTWAFELVYGKLFKAMSKHMPANTATFSIYSSNQSEQHQQPPSPIQWGNPDTIQKLLGNGSSDETLKDIHFERGVVKIPVLSPNHYWARTSTKSGSVIHAIQAIKEPSKIEAMKKDVLEAITPHYKDNELKLDYLITKAIKKR